ncbi:MAG: ABC-ATPase domain-containing protein [Ardenticatenia bacterium]|nr:ABC-ATPase domain-containing protein [Ardenticatenia bacterium]
MSPTRSADELRRLLARLDGRGYKAYKEIAGAYRFPGFVLFVDHVQGDPFAAPSRLRVRVPQARAGFPPELYSTPSRAVGVENFLARQFAAVARATDRQRGTGHSGRIAIDAPGQEVLRRTAVTITESWVEARFTVGLPARGRTILGQQAIELLLEDVPHVVARTLHCRAHDPEVVRCHAEVNEDADWLRAQLTRHGLVAFVADGAVLPRRSGVDDRPLAEGVVVPFESPPSLRVRFHLPNGGLIEGMGIPKGVTLIVGGGYHGKSTLLRAIERGVYNHCPGDGREFVVTVPDAVKIRAEDGRSVTCVNISPFIDNLPFGQSTRHFSTTNASGSTSQAANIVEALEVGTSLLLIDEDTSATNFMIRDHRMQELIAKEHEPITPFIDKVRQLHDELGVSTVVVLGGSGDYFDVADTVIALHAYRPWDATAQAKAIAARYATGRRPEGGDRFGDMSARAPDPRSVDPSKGRREVRVKAHGTRAIQFGQATIELEAVEQLVHPAQTRAIAAALVYARHRYMDGQRSLRQIVELVMRDVDEQGLDVLDRRMVGDLAAFRPQELAAALNRLRTLVMYPFGG